MSDLPQEPDPADPPDSHADSPHRVMIVVGSHLRAEQADRPLAYRLVEEIENWKEEYQAVLGVEIDPTVCTDLWYLNHDELRSLPTVCIGGPGVNALSAYLAQHLSDDNKRADVLLQIDPDFTDLQACVWGTDHELTAHGVQLFVDRYLDGYLRAVATQVEPRAE
ncbi:MAG: hypothetical protein AAFX76_04120 [Planctomycetota bacterium]